MTRHRRLDPIDGSSHLIKSIHNLPFDLISSEYSSSSRLPSEVRKISAVFFALLLHESNLFDNSSLIDSYLTQIYELFPGVFGFCVGEHWVSKIKHKQMEDIKQLAIDGCFYISMDLTDKSLKGLKVEDFERTADFKEFQHLPDPKSSPIFFHVKVNKQNVPTSTYVPRDKNEVTPPADVQEEPKPHSRLQKPTKSINVFDLIKKGRNICEEQAVPDLEPNDRRLLQSQNIRISITQQKEAPPSKVIPDAARLLSETSNSNSPFQHLKNNSMRVPSYLQDKNPMAESLLGQINSKINLYLPYGVKRCPLKQPMNSKRTSFIDPGHESSLLSGNEKADREKKWVGSEMPDSMSHLNGSISRPIDWHLKELDEETDLNVLASKNSHNNTDLKSIATSKGLETTPVCEKIDLSPDVSNTSPISRSLRPSIRVLRLKKDLIPLHQIDYSSNQDPRGIQGGLGLDRANSKLIRSRPSLFTPQSNRRVVQDSDSQLQVRPTSPVSSTRVDNLRIDLKKFSLLTANQSMPNMRYEFEVALEKKKKINLKRNPKERERSNPSHKQFSLKLLSPHIKNLKFHKKTWSEKKSKDKLQIHHPGTSVTSQRQTENPLSSPKNLFEKKGRKEFSLFPRRLENSVANIQDCETLVPQNLRIQSREVIRELPKQKSLIIQNWNGNNEVAEQHLNRGEIVNADLISIRRKRSVRFRGVIGTVVNRANAAKMQDRVTVNL